MRRDVDHRTGPDDLLVAVEDRTRADFGKHWRRGWRRERRLVAPGGGELLAGTVDLLALESHDLLPLGDLLRGAMLILQLLQVLNVLLELPVKRLQLQAQPRALVGGGAGLGAHRCAPIRRQAPVSVPGRRTADAADRLQSRHATLPTAAATTSRATTISHSKLPLW